jgi:hypothetical protein
MSERKDAEYVLANESNVESDRKYYTKLTTKVKRGDGTRDQDTTKIQTRHPDDVEAAKRHKKAIAEMQQMAEVARNVDADSETVTIDADVFYEFMEMFDSLDDEIETLADAGRPVPESLFGYMNSLNSLVSQMQEDAE